MRKRTLVTFMIVTSLTCAPVLAQTKPARPPQSGARMGTAQTVGNTVQIVVQSVRKACLRITLPNGAVNSPCYLKGTDIAYPLGPFTTANYCSAQTVAPAKCDPPQSSQMRAGQTLRF